jgi:hypothetical protein
VDITLLHPARFALTEATRSYAQEAASTIR